jgi:hypothetical protein
MAWKELAGKLWDGTRVYVVDGNHVRDDVSVEFVEGGHDLCYDFVPEGEIWVEKMLDADDQCHNTMHEIYEHTLMKHCKMSYDKAHEAANSVEELIRHMDPSEQPKIAAAKKAKTLTNIKGE